MNKIGTFSEISQHSKVMKNMAIISQIWHRTTFYFTCISSLLYLIMVPNMKKSNADIMEECMRTEGLTDWTLSYFSQFHLEGVGNN